MDQYGELARRPQRTMAVTGGASPATTSPNSTEGGSHMTLSVPRKTHSKSRLGCKTCKKRKIKCDEGRPACRNCLRRGLECLFPPPPASPAPAPAGSSSAPASDPRADSALNLVDLELLHNYMTATYSTLTADPDYRTLWRTTMVRRGTKCAYVMRSILAVSALHMLQLRPTETHYLAHALEHHHVASRAAIELMHDLQMSDAEDLYIFSVLTLYVAMGTPRSQETSLLIAHNSVGDWIFLLGGVRRLFEMLQHRPGGSFLQPAIKRGGQYWIRSHSPEHRGADIMHDLASLIDRNVDDPGLRSIYQHEISELRCHVSAALASSRGGGGNDDEATTTTTASHQPLDMVDAFVWHYLASGEFMQLLRQDRQEAIAIYAHSFIVFSTMENIRWMQGWATFLFSKAWRLLDDEHRLWVQWPMEEIGWAP